MDDDRIRASIDGFVAAWNERDARERSRLIERSCAPEILLVTSGRHVRGREQLESMIVDFQARCPALRAAFSSAVDVQGSLFRYTGIVEGTGPGAGGTASTPAPATRPVESATCSPSSAPRCRRLRRRRSYSS
jgi:hypothetical protein